MLVKIKQTIQAELHCKVSFSSVINGFIWSSCRFSTWPLRKLTGYLRVVFVKQFIATFHSGVYHEALCEKKTNLK